MNTVRTIVYSSLRGYRSYRGREKSAPNSQGERKIEMVQPHMPVESFDDIDNDEYDLDSYESDFTNVGEYHKMHTKEIAIEKLKVQHQIVKRKYFKNQDPPMLTWGEKEQIRILHEQDPEEWTPERLSQSFPATRDTILRVLRARWQPKSTKIIENYERRVKENWRLFKAGELALDPKFQAHLENFKNRDIKIMDEETMKKFVKPKPVFPKPKSTVFSDIIQGYLDKNKTSEQSREEDKRSSEPTKLLPGENVMFDKRDNEIAKHAKSKEFFTFDVFLRKHVDGVKENEMTPVDRVIIDEYKDRNAEAYKKDSLILQSQSAIGGFDKADTSAATLNGSSVVEHPEGNSKSTYHRDIDRSGMETGIIARQERELLTEENYPEFIKIPKQKYKRGVTYRIQDRYYDEDGQFLYRVPGLMS